MADTKYNTLEDMLSSSEKVEERKKSQLQEEKKSEEHIVPEFNEVDAMKYDMDIVRFAKQLEITNDDMKECSDKVKFLMEWAKRESDSSDILDIMLVFKKVRDVMGFKEIGKTGVNKFYQYARLKGDSERIRKEIKLLKEK
jgi:hypothetical protein